MSETLDKITAKRLKEIRPYPNNFAMVADTKNMNSLFKFVITILSGVWYLLNTMLFQALEEGLVTRFDRWNLIFLDFNYDHFEEKLVFNKPINLLTLSKNMCCNLLHIKDFCECPENFNLQQAFFTTILTMIVKSLEKLAQDGQQLLNNVQCNVTNYDEQVKSHFDEIFQTELQTQKQIYKDNSSIIRVKVEGSITMGTDKRSEVVAKYLNDVIELQKGKTVDPIRPFYRVGITDVSN